MKRTFLFLASLSFLWTSVASALTVLVSIKPIAGITLAVMEGVGKPEILLPENASDHHYHLKPADRQKIAEADLIFWVGPELESFLEKPLQQLKPHQKLVTLLPLSTTLLPLREDEHEEEHDEHTELDPHAWLLPSNAAAWAAAIANALSIQDPKNRALYQKNARAFATSAQKLELEPKISARYIAYHDGLQYFDWFTGSKTITSLHIHDHEGGTESNHLAEIHALLANKEVSCIGTEPYMEDPLIKTLRKKYKARDILLDPLGIKTPLDLKYYPHLIEYHREVLRGC